VMKYRTVEKTICVPEICMERRTIKTVECRAVVHECQVTITRQVPHTTWCEKECCIMKAEPRTRIECYTVYKPIICKKEKEICLMEPVHCKTPATRCVSKAVPVKEKRTRLEDEGQFVDQPCSVSNCKPGCKPSCEPSTKKVWIPNMVEKEFFVTTWRQEWANEDYIKVCTTLKPVTRTVFETTVTGCIPECRTREVSYTVCVPCTIKRMIPTTTYTCEQVPMTKKWVEMVPECVEKEICVPVCKMVTKKITCQVPVCE